MFFSIKIKTQLDKNLFCKKAFALIKTVHLQGISYFLNLAQGNVHLASFFFLLRLD